jgi:hypothetical protein
VRGLGFDSWTDGISCKSPAHRRVGRCSKAQPDWR